MQSHMKELLHVKAVETDFVSDIRKLPHFDTRFEAENGPSRHMCSLRKITATHLPGHL